MTPEEKIAALWRSRRSVTNPINIFDFSSEFVDVEYDFIPGRCDGLLVERKNKRPLVIINDSVPKTRQVFTLAHELGHFLIPWHGEILHIDQSIGFDSNTNPKRAILEAQANRFASELLIPKSWVNSVINNASSIIEAIEEFSTVGASLESISNKVTNSYDGAILQVKIDNRSVVEEARSSYSTRVNLPLKGKVIDSNLYTGLSGEIIEGGVYKSYWWRFANIANHANYKLEYVASEGSREILARIFADYFYDEDANRLTKVVSGKFGGINAMYISSIEKGTIYKLRERLYDSIVYHEELNAISQHREFDYYIDTMVSEIIFRNKNRKLK